jgi:hypothetical protein
MSDERDYVFTNHPFYKLETGGWITPPSMDGSMSRNPSMASGMTMVNIDERGVRGHSQGADMYVPGMPPWTPPTDFSSAPYHELPLAMAHGRSASMDMAMPQMTNPWAEPTHDTFGYGSPGQMPTPASIEASFFPSPSSTPTLPPAHHRHKSSSTSSHGGGSCTCFTVCLQSLQALHNASSPSSPPFDLVLSLNRKAVEGCAAMLACPRCMNRSGTHTAAMLLGTVIGKITSFYKTAGKSHFEANRAATNAAAGLVSGGSPAANIGTFPLEGEDGRWFELQVLRRELHKLQDVYAQFSDVCGDMSEDPEVSKAMISYLNQNLGSTLEAVTHRKGDLRYH